MPNIGFIGAGHMGNPMIKNLLTAGFSVTVFDVVNSAIAALTKEGAIAATALQDAITDQDIIISMLQTSQQVHDLCFNVPGIFSAAKAHSLYIDSSSIEITTTRLLHQAAAESNLAMLDAPVSGGVAGATAATLTFMVGGTEENFLRAQPILTAMGKKIVHAGSGGAGQAAKICNNLLLGISMIGVSEAFTLASKLGLDAKKFFEISSNASGQCWAMTRYSPVPGLVAEAPSNHDYQPGFMAKMMLKDLRLAQHAAESVAANIPLGAAATELYALFNNHGHGELDFSAIIRLLM